jgi:hypothetical protein
MNLMTGEAILLHRLMNNLSLKLFSIMAGEAQLLPLCFQKCWLV